MRTTLPYRSSSRHAVAFRDAALQLGFVEGREAMALAVANGLAAVCSSPAVRPAAALEAEGVAVDRVASHPAVLDTGAEPSYGDDVKHEPDDAQREAERQARLRRWQATR